MIYRFEYQGGDIALPASWEINIKTIAMQLLIPALVVYGALLVSPIWMTMLN